MPEPRPPPAIFFELVVGAAGPTGILLVKSGRTRFKNDPAGASIPKVREDSWPLHPEEIPMLGTSPSRQSHRFHPALELLEDRCAPAALAPLPDAYAPVLLEQSLPGKTGVLQKDPAGIISPEFTPVGLVLRPEGHTDREVIPGWRKVGPQPEPPTKVNPYGILFPVFSPSGRISILLPSLSPGRGDEVIHKLSPRVVDLYFGGIKPGDPLPPPDGPLLPPIQPPSGDPLPPLL
jgi:hypothetical protein